MTQRHVTWTAHQSTCDQGGEQAAETSGSFQICVLLEIYFQYDEYTEHQSKFP